VICDICNIAITAVSQISMDLKTTNYFSRLEKLFAFVLQHLHDCAGEDEEDLEEGLETIRKLSPFLFDLSKFFPQSAAKAIVSVVQEKYEDFVKSPKVYPTLDTVSGEPCRFPDLTVSRYY